tara:strand:- start:2861 stop:4018 length:1158 start_codon:yes stop_codon:yes gene_type:complete
MKKKIAILGSTGSIGKSLIEIIKKDKEKYEIVLLSANKNLSELIKQAKYFKVKNLIITNKNQYDLLKKKKFNIKIYNNFNNLNNIFKYKLDYIMSAISGLDGLNPTFESIKHTKKIAIANKESIICAWNILESELKKHNTKFVPVDSEHFSIWSALKKQDCSQEIDKIFITASGGPFYKLPLSKFPKIKIKDAIRHPNWNMGKKISVDSSTMMNKVFEIIEAKNIFNLSFDKLEILIHPVSYLHAIIKFKNGLSNMIIHDTDMKIPIFNSIFENKEYFINKKINLQKLNQLKLEKPNIKKFPLIKILKKIPKKISLYETVIVSTNDTLVDLFLKNKIKFNSIPKIFNKVINYKKLKKYRYFRPKNINQIIKLNNFIQLKINSLYK